MDSTIIGALLIASATVTLFNLTRLLQVDMPKRRHPIWAAAGDRIFPSPEEYARRDKEYKMHYLKKMVEHLLTFLIPAIISAVSSIFTIMLDFEKATFTLALSMFLTIISVAYQKIRLT